MGKRLYRADGRTCADGLSDYSLCGDAVEGDTTCDLAAVLYERERGPITCQRCCAVIANVRENYAGVRLNPESN